MFLYGHHVFIYVYHVIHVSRSLLLGTEPGEPSMRADSLPDCVRRHTDCDEGRNRPMPPVRVDTYYMRLKISVSKGGPYTPK
jgi:hypothetical protein